MMIKFLIGLIVSIVIAYLAFRVRALNVSGGIAAGILGTIVFGLGGTGWALVLLTFFISSSLLSRLFKSNKEQFDQLFEKGSRRDSWQVAANGGVAGVLTLLFVVLFKIFPNTALPDVLWLGFAASLAGANADTWGTEIGVLNPAQPVLLTNFKRVPKGTSGGVSWVGTLAALSGATLVGGVSVLVDYLGWAPANAIPLGVQFFIITIGGFVGALVDSLLGATAQCIYCCPTCQKETEKHPTHTCGTSTTLMRGVRWLNNDWVNGFCTMSAGILGIVLGIVLGKF